MTKEQAIDYLISSGMSDEQIKTVIDAFTCEDCISRAEVLRHRHIIYDDDGIGYSVVRVDRIIELPSVTPSYKQALEQQQILDTRQMERQLEMEYQHGYDKGWEEGRKALEQQPCDDCISREEALKVMYDNCPMYNCVCGCSSYRHIERMASVTSQPKIGRWIPMGEGFSPYRCSECGEVEFKKSNYCPDCGIKMEVEE